MERRASPPAWTGETPALHFPISDFAEDCDKSLHILQWDSI